ncbi:hypothetical protein NVIE_1611 [Nitrososphaera viennensis EN76]|uniref:Uncharacterized protein n=1 Tax=Nitrososphaera viennensis EN76 TaxID=926571 RepID=A0A060HGV6_9ARCH|nr:hypothetical protein NVIE_1611 [Nitrososphaera viennensis EN76]
MDFVPKICPKCLGSGLDMARSGTGEIVPAMHISKCMVCNGKGWLSDDSNATWISD